MKEDFERAKWSKHVEQRCLNGTPSSGHVDPPGDEGDAGLAPMDTREEKVNES